MARWILHPGGERQYGETEPDDVEDAMGEPFITATDTRDYPRGENGDNFIWKLLVFPFRIFFSQKGEMGIGHGPESYAPIVGIVSAETMEQKAIELGGDLEGAEEYYDNKFTRRR